MENKRIASVASVLIKEMAELRKNTKEILDGAHADVQENDVRETQIEKKLFNLLESDSRLAKEVVKEMEKNKIDVGMLNSKLVDLLQKLTEEQLYPTPWRVDKRNWGIVEASAKICIKDRTALAKQLVALAKEVALSRANVKKADFGDVPLFFNVSDFVQRADKNTMDADQADAAVEILAKAVNDASRKCEGEVYGYLEGRYEGDLEKLGLVLK